MRWGCGFLFFHDCGTETEDEIPFKCLGYCGKIEYDEVDISKVRNLFDLVMIDAFIEDVAFPKSQPLAPSSHSRKFENEKNSLSRKEYLILCFLCSAK